MMTTIDADWKTTARQHLRRQRAAWLGSIAAGMIAGILCAIGSNLDGGLLRGLMIGGGTAALAICVIWGTIIYLRVIDEQERDANLWSCYVGMVVYLTLFATKFLGERLALNLPITESGIFTATMATVLAVFAWKRFR